MTVELPIGVHRDRDDDAPAALRADRFNRHTFWCGQSGSGKTYALGVVLEQLLIHTKLPMVILDPNADFVRLGEIRPGADPADAEVLRRQEVRVLRSGPGHGEEVERLHVRWLDLDMVSKAAVLRLDPLRDPEEYNVLLHLLSGDVVADEQHLALALAEPGNDGRDRLRRRLENLAIMDWEVWARGRAGVEAIVAERPRATVLDLGGFQHPGEPRAAALALLDNLWRNREERRPILIVIDEAHNLCSPNPVTPLETVLTERIIQIAAEGRKYGLWLLLSTQRPSKIHPNVLSQCDNLGLMKMSAPRDLSELGEYFGYAPPDLLGASPRFAQGEVLFAGGFIPEPSVIKVSERLTVEGGSDVKVPV
jgi:DNA helicase HerA-like ATPase